MSSSPALSEKPWARTAEDVLTIGGVDGKQGLDRQTAAERLKRYGPNRLQKSGARPIWRILVDQLESVVVILLLAAAGAAAVFGRFIEAVAISAAILVNTIIGFSMELRATRAMEALQRMGRVTARVLRDGKVRQIDADALVPGDIVLLEAGDVVSADLRLIEANKLQCDEAALTGESMAVDKHVEALADADTPVADRHNMAYRGTAVTQGSGSGIVVATGMATELGHISRLVEEAEQSVTPLEKRLDALGRRLVWLTLLIAVVVAATGFIAGKDWLIMLETAIALAIAAVPEGLPVVATLALAQGMRRMARRNALVKQLDAVETLGAANLIFTDKTGTLTRNHMTLARLALARGTLTAGDDGFTLEGQTLSPDDTPELRAALETGVMCNNASLGETGGVGDPTELALLEAASRLRITRDSVLKAYPEVREIGFDPAVNMMATIHALDGEYLVAVKGAPESVIDTCTQVLTADGEEPLDEKLREQWHARSEELAAGGLRVLALARKRVADEQSEVYSGLTLLSLVGLYDPPRAGMKDIIAACRRAGIQVVMGTGDHAATAKAIAAEIGLADRDSEPVEAAQLKQLKNLTDQQRDAIMRGTVFARISPEQKLDLVRLYQEAGRVVGMTGDGVNDAPALKKADIGIAMGKRGTEVAREAADIVLKDDAFDTIVVAIEHGRAIFQNIRRFIIYLLSGNLGEIMAISAAAMVAAPLPMLPLQILYINFVSDIMPALALGLSAGESGIMRQPPRDPREALIMRNHWTAIVGYGAIIAISVLGAFATALLIHEMEADQAVTIGFLTFGFARLWHVFNMRSPDSRLFMNEITTTPVVWLSILIGTGLLFSATQIPLLAGILSVHSPGTEGWLLCLLFSLLPLVIIQLMKMTGLGWEKRSG